MDLPTRFVTHVRATGILPPGARVAVACSGGADSLALLHLLVAARDALGLGGLSVAHLDHGLRAASRDDAARVAEIAADLGVPADVRRVPVRRRRGESPEEAARRVRLAFLARAAARLGADVVATAHQLDDQAETVLYRVLRGTGIEGLRGIRAVLDLPGPRGVPAVRLVRPLLPFRRRELRDWLESRGVAWRDDPTNVGGNDRARLRNDVLPLVRSALGRDPVPPLARLAELAADPPRRDAAAVARRSAAAPKSLVPATEAARVVWEKRPVGTALFLERLRARPGTMELLASAAVRGELHVRLPRPGDRFHALGLPKPQRLGHYLQRRGVPQDERAAVPLLCDAQGILWVVGHGIAARAALGIKTRFAWVAKRV